LISFDSNILVYAADRDAGERHAQAAALIERSIRSGNCIQPLQSLCEFFNVVTRKIGIGAPAASAFVEAWQAVILVEPATLGDLVDARRAVAEHGLSFWDAMLWATVRRTGIRLFLSEDMQDGRAIEGVRIVNPFIDRNQPLIDSMLDC
jgi:predicted nucleic acid-binding protein